MQPPQLQVILREGSGEASSSGKASVNAQLLAAGVARVKLPSHVNLCWLAVLNGWCQAVLNSRHGAGQGQAGPGVRAHRSGAGCAQGAQRYVEVRRSHRRRGG